MELNRHDNDLQKISEYLDNRLSAEDAADFKRQLAADDDLRKSYETIFSTRLLLKHSPRRRAPHNFTLSEKTAGAIRKRVVWLPILRLSSAFSAAISIIIFIFTFLTNNPAISPSMMMAAAPAAEKSISPEGTSLPPIIVWGNPVSGMGGGGYGGGGAEGSGKGGGAPQTMSVQNPLMLGAGAPPATAGGTSPTLAPESIPPAVAVPPSEIVTAPTSPSEPNLPQPPATDTQQALPAPTSAARSLPPITGSGPILGIRPSVTNGTIQNQVPESQITKIDSRGIWTIAGSILLLIGALTGISAIYLARKNH